MRPCIPLLIAVLSAPAAAQTYKWVDEQGVTNYGTKPSAGRQAKPVDTQSRNTIDTGEAQKGAEPDARPQAVLQPPPPPWTAPAVPAQLVRGMNFDTYIRLQRGMTEGELLQRAGQPDYVALENARSIQKSFYYYPTHGDPFTTVVTVRGGRIDNIERTKKF